jgi:hypothetical protein
VSAPTGLGPDEFHNMLVDVLDGFSPAQPVIAPLQRRGLRRRRLRYGGFAAAVAVVAAAAIAIPLALAGSSAPERVRIGKPARHSHSPTPAQARRQGLIDCRRFAARHTFLEAESAVLDAGGAVSITGHRGFETCGGPDDVSYNWHQATATFVVAPSAVVRRVFYNSRGARTKTIALDALPQYLRDDHNGKFFQYDGPIGAITRLTEYYHP